MQPLGWFGLRCLCAGSMAVCRERLRRWCLR